MFDGGVYNNKNFLTVRRCGSFFFRLKKMNILQTIKTQKWPLIIAAILFGLGALLLLSNWLKPTLPVETTNTQQTIPSSTTVNINSEGNSKPTVETGNASITINNNSLLSTDTIEEKQK